MGWVKGSDRNFEASQTERCVWGKMVGFIDWGKHHSVVNQKVYCRRKCGVTMDPALLELDDKCLQHASSYSPFWYRAVPTFVPHNLRVHTRTKTLKGRSCGRSGALVVDLERCQRSASKPEKGQGRGNSACTYPSLWLCGLAGSADGRVRGMLSVGIGWWKFRRRHAHSAVLCHLSSCLLLLQTCGASAVACTAAKCIKTCTSAASSGPSCQVTFGLSGRVPLLK